MPVPQATTVHDFVIKSIIGDPGVTNQEILVELQDKLKMMVATDTETLKIDDPFGTWFVDRYFILVEALDENGNNVIFNLKEVYLCGDGDGPLELDLVHIQNINLDETDKNLLSPPEITITDKTGGVMSLVLLTGNGCVDLISELAKSGRAGEVGLGSDERLAIQLVGDNGDHVDSVKCIAFTPNAAETLVCDILPILT